MCTLSKVRHSCRKTLNADSATADLTLHFTHMEKLEMRTLEGLISECAFRTHYILFYMALRTHLVVTAGSYHEDLGMGSHTCMQIRSRPVSDLEILKLKSSREKYPIRQSDTQSLRIRMTWLWRHWIEFNSTHSNLNAEWMIEIRSRSNFSALLERPDTRSAGPDVPISHKIKIIQYPIC